MRNALLPSMPSWLHYYENDEVQLEILKASMQMDDLIGYFLSNGFNMESRSVFNSDNQLGEGVYTLPSQSQSLIYDNNHQPGSLYGISSTKDISPQSLLLGKKPSLFQYEEVSGNARKRQFEVVEDMTLLKKMKSNPQSKITFLEPKQHHAREASELHVPMRRNQKFSEKIATLQKLVSPLGKTDTASVLHEAFLYINLLQEQIKTFFQMLSCSYTSTIESPYRQECGDKLQVGLRSRGLCLVPMSITQKVTMEEQIHHAYVSRTILPRNFNSI